MLKISFIKKKKNKSCPDNLNYYTTVMNQKVNYSLIESKVQIKTRNATSCNNRDDLLHLSFTF